MCRRNSPATPTKWQGSPHDATAHGDDGDRGRPVLRLAACGGGDDNGDGGGGGGGGGEATGKIGVILPDTESSVRWETADRPLLEAAFEEAGVEYDIQNAEGDAQRMARSPTA